jgi:tetratricopeptide (TPR) repeat protein
LGSSDIELLNDLGRFCLEKRKLAGAEKVFRRSIEVYPTSPAGPINLSQVLYLKGDIEEAKFWYKKGISLGGVPVPYFEFILNTSKKEK